MPALDEKIKNEINATTPVEPPRSALDPLPESQPRPVAPEPEKPAQTPVQAAALEPKKNVAYDDQGFEIDLTRPWIKMGKGVGTEYSQTVGVGDKYVNIPKINEGKLMSNEEAYSYAAKQGWDKYPSFGTVEEAESAAQKRHEKIASTLNFDGDAPDFVQNAKKFNADRAALQKKEPESWHGKLAKTVIEAKEKGGGFSGITGVVFSKIAEAALDRVAEDGSRQGFIGGAKYKATLVENADGSKKYIYNKIEPTAADKVLNWGAEKVAGAVVASTEYVGKPAYGALEYVARNSPAAPARALRAAVDAVGWGADYLSDKLNLDQTTEFLNRFAKEGALNKELPDWAQTAWAQWGMRSAMNLGLSAVGFAQGAMAMFDEDEEKDPSLDPLRKNMKAISESTAYQAPSPTEAKKKYGVMSKEFVEAALFSTIETLPSQLPVLGAYALGRRYGGNAGGVAAASITGGLMEASGYYQDLIDSGVSHEEAAARAMVYGFVSMGLNSVSEFQFGRMVEAKGLKRKFLNFAGGVPVEGITEAGEAVWIALDKFGRTKDVGQFYMDVDRSFDDFVGAAGSAVVLGGGTAGYQNLGRAQDYVHQQYDKIAGNTGTTEYLQRERRMLERQMADIVADGNPREIQDLLAKKQRLDEIEKEVRGRITEGPSAPAMPVMPSERAALKEEPGVERVTPEGSLWNKAIPVSKEQRSELDQKQNELNSVNARLREIGDETTFSTNKMSEAPEAISERVYLEARRTKLKGEIAGMRGVPDTAATEEVTTSEQEEGREAPEVLDEAPAQETGQAAPATQEPPPLPGSMSQNMSDARVEDIRNSIADQNRTWSTEELRSHLEDMGVKEEDMHLFIAGNEREQQLVNALWRESVRRQRDPDDEDFRNRAEMITYLESVGATPEEVDALFEGYEKEPEEAPAEAPVKATVAAPAKPPEREELEIKDTKAHLEEWSSETGNSDEVVAENASDAISKIISSDKPVPASKLVLKKGVKSYLEWAEKKGYVKKVYGANGAAYYVPTGRKYDAENYKETEEEGKNLKPASRKKKAEPAEAKKEPEKSPEKSPEKKAEPDKKPAAKAPDKKTNTVLDVIDAMRDKFGIGNVKQNKIGVELIRAIMGDKYTYDQVDDYTVRVTAPNGQSTVIGSVEHVPEEFRDDFFGVHKKAAGPGGAFFEFPNVYFRDEESGLNISAPDLIVLTARAFSSKGKLDNLLRHELLHWAWRTGVITQAEKNAAMNVFSPGGKPLSWLNVSEGNKEEASVTGLTKAKSIFQRAIDGLADILTSLQYALTRTETDRYKVMKLRQDVRSGALWDRISAGTKPVPRKSLGKGMAPFAKDMFSGVPGFIMFAPSYSFSNTYVPSWLVRATTRSMESLRAKGWLGVGTSYPMSKVGDVEPHTGPTDVSLARAASNPKFLKVGADVIRSYNVPGITKDMSDIEVHLAFQQFLFENLDWLMGKIPGEIKKRSRMWYVGANKIAKDLAKQYGYTAQQTAGVIACLSPQRDWFINVANASRLIDIYSTQQDTVWDENMTLVLLKVQEYTDEHARQAGKVGANHLIFLKSLIGKKLSDLKSDPVLEAYFVRIWDTLNNSTDFFAISPEGNFLDYAQTNSGQNRTITWGSTDEMAKAISVLKDGSYENISNRLGAYHKVRSFYNNIVEPFSDLGEVTIDTHAVAAAWLSPMSQSSKEVKDNFSRGTASAIGMVGMYYDYADVYRAIARKHGMLPREAQSITWEAIRGMFDRSAKANKQTSADISKIWDGVKSGERSASDAREEIFKRMGGIAPPEWAIPSSEVGNKARWTHNERELHRLGLPGRIAPGSRPGTTLLDPARYISRVKQYSGKLMPARERSGIGELTESAQIVLEARPGTSTDMLKGIKNSDTNLLNWLSNVANKAFDVQKMALAFGVNVTRSTPATGAWKGETNPATVYTIEIPEDWRDETGGLRDEARAKLWALSATWGILFRQDAAGFLWFEDDIGFANAVDINVGHALLNDDAVALQGSIVDRFGDDAVFINTSDGAVVLNLSEDSMSSFQSEIEKMVKDDAVVKDAEINQVVAHAPLLGVNYEEDVAGNAWLSPRFYDQTSIPEELVDKYEPIIMRVVKSSHSKIDKAIQDWAKDPRVKAGTWHSLGSKERPMPKRQKPIVDTSSEVMFAPVNGNREYTEELMQKIRESVGKPLATIHDFLFRGEKKHDKSLLKAFEKGGRDAVTKQAAQMYISFPKEVKTVAGDVVVKNERRYGNLMAHYSHITTNNKNGALDLEKISTLPHVVDTLTSPLVIARDNIGAWLYLSTYDDGIVHNVIVNNDTGMGTQYQYTIKRPESDWKIEWVRGMPSENIMFAPVDTRDLAERSGPAPEGHIWGWHWGTTKVDTLDPSMHGTGIRGAERKRKEAYPSQYVPRIYVGLSGYIKEAALGAQRHRVAIPTEQIYDVKADKDGLIPRAIEIAQKEGFYGDAAVTTIFEKLVADEGWLGTAFGDVAILFKPIKVQQHVDEARDAEQMEAGDEGSVMFAPADKIPEKTKIDEYVFHRGKNPRTSPQVVLYSDNRESIRSYGKNEFALHSKHLEYVPDWVQEYAERYYRDQYGDEYENYLRPEVDPENIVSYANVWDDPDFVSQFYQDNEDRLDELKKSGIYGFKTRDGAVTFPVEDIPVIDVDEDQFGDAILRGESGPMFAPSDPVLASITEEQKKGIIKAAYAHLKQTFDRNALQFIMPDGNWYMDTHWNDHNDAAIAIMRKAGVQFGKEAWRGLAAFLHAGAIRTGPNAYYVQVGTVPNSDQQTAITDLAVNGNVGTVYIEALPETGARFTRDVSPATKANLGKAFRDLRSAYDGGVQFAASADFTPMSPWQRTKLAAESAAKMVSAMKGMLAKTNDPFNARWILPDGTMLTEDEMVAHRDMAEKAMAKAKDPALDTELSESKTSSPTVVATNSGIVRVLRGFGAVQYSVPLTGAQKSLIIENLEGQRFARIDLVSGDGMMSVFGSFDRPEKSELRGWLNRAAAYMEGPASEIMFAAEEAPTQRERIAQMIADAKSAVVNYLVPDDRKAEVLDALYRGLTKVDDPSEARFLMPNGKYYRGNEFANEHGDAAIEAFEKELPWYTDELGKTPWVRGMMFQDVGAARMYYSRSMLSTGGLNLSTTVPLTSQQKNSIVDLASNIKAPSYIDALTHDNMLIASEQIPPESSEREARAVVDRVNAAVTHGIMFAPAPPSWTENFINWFRGSKVVGADGNPLVLFHGTKFTGIIDEFDRAKTSVKKAGFGFHFGNIEAARKFTRKGGSIYPVVLSIKNPLEMEDAGDWLPARFADALGNKFVDDLVKRIEDAARNDRGIRKDIRETLNQYSLNEYVRRFGSVAQLVRNETISALQEAGYDGIKYPNRLEGTKKIRIPVEDILYDLDEASASGWFQGYKSVYLYYIDGKTGIKTIFNNLMLNRDALLSDYSKSDLDDLIKRNIRERYKRNGYVETHIPSGYSYAVFNSDQVKSIYNKGSYKGTRIMFAPAQEDEKGYLGNLWDAIWHVRDKNQKPELTKLWRFLGTIQHYSEKVPALRAVFESAVRLRDNKHAISQKLFAEALTSMRDLKKKAPEAYVKLNEYLFTKDRNADGFRVFQVKDDEWAVKEKVGEEWKTVQAGFSNEDAAWMHAYSTEMLRYIAAGGNKDAAATLLEVRMLNHRVHNLLKAQINELLHVFQRNGTPIRKAEIGGKTMDLFDAMREMGDRRGYYMPRLRGGGKYQLIIKKGSENTLINYDTDTGRNFAFAYYKSKGYSVEKRLSNRPSQEAYEADVVAMSDLLSNALARVEKAQKGEVNFEGLGLESGRYEYTRKDGKTETHLIITGNIGNDSRDILKAFGGRYYEDNQTGAGPGWHFTSPTPKLESRLLAALTHTDVAGLPYQSLQDSLLRSMAEVMHQRGSRSVKIGRSDAVGEDVWLGYEGDMIRALVRSVNSAAGGTAKRIMAKEMMKAISGTATDWTDFKAESLPDDFDSMDAVGQQAELQKAWKAYMKHVSENRIDSALQAEAFSEARSFMTEMIRNEEASERVFGVIKGIASIKYLSGIAPSLVNLTSLVTNVPAVFHGFGDIPFHRTAKNLARGIKNHVQHWIYRKWNSGSPLSREDQWLFDEISRRGWDEPLLYMEAIESLQNQAGIWWNKATTALMLPFSITEKMNRGGTIAAAYYSLLEAEKGVVTDKRKEELLQKAKYLSDTAHAQYGKVNLPSFARGSSIQAQATRSWYMYQTYAHNWMQVAYRLGADKRDAKALAWHLVSPTLIAGPGVFVAGGLVEAILSKILGLFGDEPDDLSEEWYQWMGTTFGSPGSNFARGGLAGLFGINLKGSMSMGLFSVPTELSDLLGAPAGMVRDFADAAKAAGRGDAVLFAEKAAPRILASPIRAYREATRGLSTKDYYPRYYGEDIVRPGTYSTILRTIGWNPQEVAGKTEQQWNEYKIKQQYDAEKADLYARMRFHILSGGDTKDWLDLLAEAEEFNSRVVYNQYQFVAPITDESIKRIVKGVNEAPKSERQREKPEEIEAEPLTMTEERAERGGSRGRGRR